MHRSVFALFIAALVAACGPRPVSTPASPEQAIGASSPRAAVEKFLGAVKAQDLQAMALIWGTENGPARDQVARDQLEKRELIMQCYLSHDDARIVRDLGTQEGRHNYLVELTKGQLVRSTTFHAILGPNERWFIENVDLEPVSDLCRSGGD